MMQLSLYNGNFGYGLSYTTFEYSNLRVNHPSFTATDELQFSVDVTNTGKRVGKEAVMLFSSDHGCFSRSRKPQTACFQKSRIATRRNTNRYFNYQSQ